MCYPDDARPPDHGRGGEVASAEDLVLTAADGNQLAAYHARPAAPTGAGIVILPDVRGLHNFYKALACRFAEAGVEAVAIDYFGRTAGVGTRDDDFDYKPHTEQTTPDAIAADTRAGIDHVRSTAGGGVARVFTVGFCFGGGNSWRQSADQPHLAGAIGFYGRPERVRDAIERMKAPLLMLIAGADFTPKEEFEALDQQLTEAGVEHRMVTFEGAPHSFFDRGYAQFQDECRRSWEEMLAFIEA
jgi:carboxymethylenebutenolidase